jgi:hypothetical protein
LYDESQGFRNSLLNRGWHHVAWTSFQSDATGPGNTTRFFIDGEVFGNSGASAGQPDSSSRFCIGNSPAGTRGAQGWGTTRICHVYAYARRLGIAEMKARVAAMNLLAYAPTG